MPNPEPLPRVAAAGLAAGAGFVVLVPGVGVACAAEVSAPLFWAGGFVSSAGAGAEDALPTPAS